MAHPIVNDEVKGAKIQLSLNVYAQKCGSKQIRNLAPFLHHCQLQLKNVKNSKLVRRTLQSRMLLNTYAITFSASILRFFKAFTDIFPMEVMRFK